MQRAFEEICVQQGSPEWLHARAGHVTGSRADDVRATLKSGKPAASREDYRAQLVAERLTGKPQEEFFENAAMKRGTLLEPYARAAYEQHTGYMVVESGFLRSTTRPWVGCSIDGHIAGPIRKIIEIKCPGAKNHLKWLRDARLPAAYEAQVLHNLIVTGADSCDFVSYHPDMPEHLQLFIVTVLPALLPVEEYTHALDTFLSDVARDTEEWSTWTA